MSKLRKLKDIDSYTRVKSLYERQKKNREQALEVANNCDPRLKEPKKYLLKN